MPDDFNGLIARIEQKATQNRPDRISSEFKRGDNAKVSAAAAKSPEEIVVFRGTGDENSAIRSDYLTAQQIVNGHAVFAH